METQHTPGPWTHGPESRDITGSDGKPVAKVVSWRPEEEEVANAHLIAAVPDMLKALEEANEYIQSRKRDGDADSWSIRLEFSLPAALAKAKGES